VIKAKITTIKVGDSHFASQNALWGVSEGTTTPISANVVIFA